MPIWRRKRVQLTQPPTHLLDHPDPDSTTVYYLDKTGEIFDDYEFVFTASLRPRRQLILPTPEPMLLVSTFTAPSTFSAR
jgi:hypothetical protein